TQCPDPPRPELLDERPAGRCAGFPGDGGGCPPPPSQQDSHGGCVLDRAAKEEDRPVGGDLANPVENLLVAPALLTQVAEELRGKIAESIEVFLELRIGVQVDGRAGCLQYFMVRVSKHALRA